MENMEDNFRHIKGWGVDADPRNEPTYPMKHYTGDDHQRLNHERPAQQPADVEILKSNERPSLSAVFGTSTPPSGLSGIIRRKAFSQSEGRLGHWMPLILADRMNVIEGLIDDVRNGYLPNFFVEKGWKAEVRYNPVRFFGKIVVAALVTTAVVTLMVRKKRRRHI